MIIGRQAPKHTGFFDCLDCLMHGGRFSRSWILKQGRTPGDVAGPGMTTTMNLTFFTAHTFATGFSNIPNQYFAFAAC